MMHFSPQSMHGQDFFVVIVLSHVVIIIVVLLSLFLTISLTYWGET